MSRSVVPIALDRWRVVKLASSIGALLVLVVAIPVVLATVGGVPFSHIGVAEISHSLVSRHPGNPHLVAGWIIGSVLVLAWLAWAWMTVCIVVELRSWVTGRTPVRLPASRTVQSVAACLVGTALAMAAVGKVAPTPMRQTATETTAVSSRPKGSSAAMGPAGPARTVSPGFDSGVVPISFLLGEADTDAATQQGNHSRSKSNGRWDRVPVPVEHVSPRAEDEAITTASMRNGTGRRDMDAREVSNPPPGAAGCFDRVAVPKTHLVRSHETLWSIAEDELGTALRWNELAECNYGITQADGQSLDGRHWVVPGWRLLLPTTPVADRPTAEPVAEVPRREPTPTPTPVPVPTKGARRLAPPAPTSNRAAISDRVDEPADSDRVPPAPTSDQGVPDPVTPPGAPRPFTPPVPVVPLGGGVVGAGVIRLLDRLRHVQQRHRPEGTYIRLPEGDHIPFEQRLRVGEGRTLIAEVDAAIRWATRSEPDATPEPPRTSRRENSPGILGVRIHAEVIELVLAEETRRVVVVDRSTLAVEGIAADVAAAPLLVTVGREPIGLVMVNLESLGSLVVSGSSGEADAVVRALALELATSHWAGQFSVAVVGFGSELDRFEGVTSHQDCDDLIRSMYRRNVDGAELLRSSGYPSFAEARRVEPSERWAPAVVICGPGVSEADVVELIAIGSDPRLGMAVVAVGERLEAQHSVRLMGDSWSASLRLLGAVAFPQRISTEEWDEVTSLLDTAATRESVYSSEEPYVNLPIRLPPPLLDAAHATEAYPGSVRPSDASETESALRTESGWPGSIDSRTRAHLEKRGESTGGPGPDAEIMVAVLGPVEVHGLARPFSRASAEELVVYLAMHPMGVSNERWATALWPDRLMAPSSLHSTASVARRALGTRGDGSDHLPRSHGRLMLAGTVGTDWDHFVTLAASDRPEQWRQALMLVRGRPFEGLRSSDWPILEGIAPAIEAAVVDLSGRLAGTYLLDGDATAAEWAARRGLVVSPYDERLYRMLMRAADVGGNPAGVDAVMAELLRLVADDIEPLDAVHPSTMDLYRQLSRRKRLPRS